MPRSGPRRRARSEGGSRSSGRTVHRSRSAPSRYAEGVPFALDAGGFDRHTFLCGQSGSGKTYALGTILERLLLETSIRIVILDPNSDYARLAETRADDPSAVAARYAATALGIAVRRGISSGDDRLRVRAAELEPALQAALLRLDPVADREEYASLLDILGESMTARRAGLARGSCDERRARRARARAAAPGARDRSTGRCGRATTPARCSTTSAPTACAASSSTSARSRRPRSRRSPPRRRSRRSGGAATTAGRC